MSEECSHDCSACGKDCKDRTTPQSFLEEPNASSNIKKVIGIVSGKGGVGKSLVTSLLAVAMQKKRYRCAILDADITGPSIPRMFGIGNHTSSGEGAADSENGLLPAKAQNGVKIMSVNLLLENETDPVVWRGPLIAGMVKQFWTDVCWGDVDYLFVDMPPGTGDVPLTVFQSLPVDGIVVVTSPQELVGMIVGKAVKMADMLHIPVLGLVENMAYFECPTCHEKHFIFGNSQIEQLAAQYDIRMTAQIPIDSTLAALCDEGRIADVQEKWLMDFLNGIM